MKKICFSIVIFFIVQGLISCGGDKGEKINNENAPVPSQNQTSDSDRTSVKISPGGVEVENKSGNKRTEVEISTDSLKFESEKRK